MAKIYYFKAQKPREDESEKTVIVRSTPETFLDWFAYETGFQFSFDNDEFKRSLTYWGHADSVTPTSPISLGGTIPRIASAVFSRMLISGEGANKVLHFTKTEGSERQIHVKFPIHSYGSEMESRTEQARLFLLLKTIAELEAEYQAHNRKYILVSVDNKLGQFVNLFEVEATSEKTSPLPRAFLSRSGISLEPVPGKSLVIGRATFHINFELPKAHVNLISKAHFEILCRRINGQGELGYFIRDLNSTNGTYLNRGKLPPEQVFQLQFGDRITSGGVSLIFQSG